MVCWSLHGEREHLNLERVVLYLRGLSLSAGRNNHSKKATHSRLPSVSYESRQFAQGCQVVDAD